VKISFFAIIGCLLAFISGCGGGNSYDNSIKKDLEMITLELSIIKLENKHLTLQTEKALSENKELQKQVDILTGLEQSIKAGKAYSIDAVKFGRYTNLYDNDKDGKMETLAVHLQPKDDAGDKVKAAGEVTVELWDLNKKGENAQLGRWEVGAKELKKSWAATLLTTSYRLKFDISDKVDNYKTPLTVKITFTDYLTGKAFHQQREITPQ
jgi:hypothetical protein